jgi:hypothetical protein
MASFPPSPLSNQLANVIKEARRAAEEPARVQIWACCSGRSSMGRR